eukprot:CAMPEP_0202458890 /NCGR_PEP_ID=MMETSP1360-20130828/28662_1 /ASSEMBLY_ACC=CAM_ASM_000848 /TAXON_ID=515479 /ORGANISM="Licmophora paradoxa, Strain CCMP2313" /LENGTH=124 /DNA_ID=CAMNT_0049079647 /DNA_START=214 /DNA_END=588 /DNA_ORIENTATION=+
MDLPGVKPEDLKVEVEQGTFFRISGKRTIGIKLPTEFSRRFALGDSANLHNMRANLSEGVLIITVPKRTNEAAPVVIQIGQARAKSADDTSGDDNEQPNENETVAAGLKKSGDDLDMADTNSST